MHRLTIDWQNFARVRFGTGLLMRTCEYWNDWITVWFTCEFV